MADARPGWSLAGALAHWGRARGAANAIVDGDRAVTWSALDALVRARAAELAGAGVAAGDTVAVVGANSTAWCTTALAVLALRATILPVHARSTPAETAYLLDHSGCAAIAADEATADAALAAAEAAAEPPAVLPMTGAPAARVASRARPGTPPAVVAYTSGTTGRPKGVELTAESLLAGSWFLARTDAARDVRILLVQPVSYTSGLISTFLAAVCNGWTLVLEPRFDAERTLRVVAEQRVTTFRSVPLIWQDLAAAASFARTDLSSLRTAHVGGAPVPEDLLLTWQDRGVALCQGYGLTETAGAVTFCPPEEAVRRRRSVGTGGPHCDIEVRDAAGQVAEPGAVGEIHVRGPNVMRGYRDDPGATAAAFDGGWLRTGDLATRDADGFLEVVGRSKELIISGGINVYPAEIERVIAALDGVVEVAVVGMPHDRFGEAPAAVVRTLATGVEAAVEDACRTALASHKVPRRIVLTTEPLPRTASGKISKLAVRERFLTGGG